MATHSSILAWRIPMDRGAWQATVPRGLKEVDKNELLSTAHAHTPPLSVCTAMQVDRLATQQPAPWHPMGTAAARTSYSGHAPCGAPCGAHCTVCLRPLLPYDALEEGGEGWWLVLFTGLAWVPQWLIIIFSPSSPPGKLCGFLHSGDLVIVVTGWQPGSGHTNIMRVLSVT